MRIGRRAFVAGVSACGAGILPALRTRARSLSGKVRSGALVATLALLAAVCLLSPQAFASTATGGTTRHTHHPATPASAGAHKTVARHRRASSKTSSAKRASAAHRTALASRKRKGRKAKPRRSTAYTRLAQMQMDPTRVESIQQALIDAGTYHGTPTGRWDSETRDAMARYQTENGFGVTGLPDAKSLMKMGLGPHPLPPELNKTPATGPASAEGAAALAPVPSPAAPAKTPADPANPPVLPPSRN
jgi:hypothetical protein